ncbi:MAG: tetratricopeptide repeat protein [Isosphaeraceae bacterium]
MSRGQFDPYDDDDGWGRPAPGFFEKVKRNYRDWQRHRQAMAAEKRELRGLQQENQPKRHENPNRQSMASKAEIASNDIIDTDRYLKMKGDGLLAKTDWQIWKDDRRIRRQIIAEQRGYDESLAMHDSASARRGPVSGSDFGVGSEKIDAPDGTGQSLARSLAGEFGTGLWRTGFLGWLLAMLPAAYMIFFLIVQCMSGHHDRYVARTGALRTRIPNLLSENNATAAQIIGQRLFDCQIAQIDDIFRYFETLQAAGKPQEALYFLKSSESLVKATELGPFNFRFARELLKQNPNVAALSRDVIPLLQESLKHNIPQQDKIEARQILSRFASSQGDLNSALRFLEPIENANTSIAADVLWIRSNLGPATDAFNLEASVRRLISQLDDEIDRTRGKPTEAQIGARVRLLMIDGKEAELRQWLGGLENLTLDKKQMWSREIDQISLAAEMKRQPLDVAKVWLKLQPLLESNPDNLLWARMATMLWAMPAEKRYAEAYDWVQNRLARPEVSLDFLRLAAQLGHAGGQWDKIRPLYEEVIKRDPGDIAALNNLAGIYYKFPPYNYPRGMQLIEKAINLVPDNLGIQETRAQILARLGKTDEAKSILERCLVVFPNEWNIHNTLAQIYEIEGQKSRAAAHREHLRSLRKPVNAPLIDNIAADPKTDSTRK